MIVLKEEKWLFWNLARFWKEIREYHGSGATGNIRNPDKIRRSARDGNFLMAIPQMDGWEQVRIDPELLVPTQAGWSLPGSARGPPHRCDASFVWRGAAGLQFWQSIVCKYFNLFLPTPMNLDLPELRSWRLKCDRDFDVSLMKMDRKHLFHAKYSN